MGWIDLRSDTVTRPSDAMRHAMSQAPVGDDQYGEDPSVNALQEVIADALGKEAALFVPSGTMANQIALKLFTQPGDDVVVGRQSHAVFHETGASAAISGVQFSEVGSDGLFTAEDFEVVLKPRRHAIYQPTTLVEVENTHNRGGGLIFPQDEVERICAAARRHDVATYLDGARLFNVAAATNLPLDRLAQPFDLASVALSKALGAPVGSVIAGTKDAIARATRFRRMLGGALRQGGILAAAGLYAFENNRARLVEDHANARMIAERIASVPNVAIDVASMRTNIIVFRLTAPGMRATRIVEACREKGVLLLAFTPTMLRAVTHLDVDAAACRRAADLIVDALMAEQRAAAMKTR